MDQTTDFYCPLLLLNVTKQDILKILDILRTKQEAEKTISSLTHNTNNPHMQLG